jgi:hypothetical protein
LIIVVIGSSNLEKGAAGSFSGSIELSGQRPSIQAAIYFQICFGLRTAFPRAAPLPIVKISGWLQSAETPNVTG